MKYYWDGRTWVPAHVFRPKSPQLHNIMPDIKPCVSPIDGTVLGSRSTRREHMKVHDVVEVGNERLTPQGPYQPKGVGEDIKRAWEKLYG